MPVQNLYQVKLISQISIQHYYLLLTKRRKTHNPMFDNSLILEYAIRYVIYLIYESLTKVKHFEICNDMFILIIFFFSKWHTAVK